MKKRAGNVGLTLIGLFKLVKGAALIVVAVGLLRLLHRDVQSTVTHWVELLRMDPGNHYIHTALSKVFRVTPAQLRELSAGTFLYAGLFLTEGIGLLKRRHWAEYLTVISTALFLPLEVYEIWRHFTFVRLGVLLVNLAIVWYLLLRLKGGRRA